MMRRIWSAMGSVYAFRILSVVAACCFAVAALGKTGSYFDALNSAAMFLAIWLLGLNSRSAEPNDKDTP